VTTSESETSRPYPCFGCLTRDADRSTPAPAAANAAAADDDDEEDDTSCDVPNSNVTVAGWPLNRASGLSTVDDARRCRTLTSPRFVRTLCPPADTTDHPFCTLPCVTYVFNKRTMFSRGARRQRTRGAERDRSKQALRAWHLVSREVDRNAPQRVSG
jgi:hypothetical protein